MLSQIGHPQAECMNVETIFTLKSVLTTHIWNSAMRFPASNQIVVSFTYVYASKRPDVMTAAQSSNDASARNFPDIGGR